MIAEPNVSAKFQVISQMGVGILELKGQIASLNAQLEIERARANKAESQVRQLEAQLTHPKREIKTLMQSMNELRPEDIAKSDRDLADLRNQGWEVLNITVTVNVIGVDSFHDRIVTLERVAPIPAEPQQPSATVATEERATPKTVALSAIVGVDEVAESAPATALSTKSVSPREAAFLADLHTALQAKAEEIERTNPFYGYQPRSFRDMMTGHTQP